MLSGPATGLYWSAAASHPAPSATNRRGHDSTTSSQAAASIAAAACRSRVPGSAPTPAPSPLRQPRMCTQLQMLDDPDDQRAHEERLIEPDRFGTADEDHSSGVIGTEAGSWHTTWRSAA
jgi:hypothetical protein